ncbi:hypothetical protein GQ54DRAFT_320165 [Martensiomyces pterosporus]|nr:hypothetical protein GQ54DRAFT_320165 [Martensiomyces pterosporus]
MSSNSVDYGVVFTELNTSDHVFFYLQIAVVLTNIPISTYLLVCRKYPPIKAITPWLTAAVGIGIMLFAISLSVVSGSASYTGIFAPCTLWGSWFLITFGIGVFITCHNFRMIQFYRVFKRKRAATLWQAPSLRGLASEYWPMLVIFLPALFTSIFAEALPGNLSVMHVVYKDMPTCKYNYSYVFWVYGYFGGNVIVGWVFFFMVRNVAKHFKIFRMIFPIMSILTVYSILVATVVGFNGPAYYWGRCIIAICNTFVLNSVFWLHSVSPVFGHLFTRDDYLKSFLDDVYDDTLAGTRFGIPNARRELYGREVFYGDA